MGMLGLGPSSPTLTQVPLEQQTQGLISDRRKYAEQTPEQIAASANSGVGGAGNSMLQSPEKMSQEAAGSGENASMLQAVRNQYGQTANKGIQSIVQNNDLNSNLKKGQLMSQSMSTTLAQNQIATQNYQQMTDLMNQSQMARAQAINSILNLAGTATGAYMGSQNRTRRQRQTTQSNFNVSGGESPAMDMDVGGSNGGHGQNPF